MLIAVIGLLPSSKQIRSPGLAITPAPNVARRLAAAGLLSTAVSGLRAAAAFDNGIPDMQLYRNKTKYPGTQPTLGLQANGKLKSCTDGPNCFSTSGDENHRLPPWKPRAGSDTMAELLETIEAYPPGSDSRQARVDKGGWKVVKQDASYLYVQFESLKRGFIDDVEFAVARGGELQVRSSSRLGFLDLGVKA